MAVTFRGWGAVVVGTTSVVPGWVAGSVGDCLLAVPGNKPYSSVPAAPDGTWTQVVTATSGSVANAVSTGSTCQTTFVKTATSTATGSATFTIASGSPAIGHAGRWGTDSGAFSVVGVAVTDTDETLTTVSATGTVAAGAIASGDKIAIAVMLKDDAIVHTLQTLTIAGCTLGAITWVAVSTTTGGNDGAQYKGTCSVTAGSSTGAVTYTATSSVSGASAAAVNVVAVREVTAVPTGLAVASVSASELDVSWDAVTGATSYTLERSLDGSTGWSTVFSGNATSYNDTGRSSATSYYYRVSATSSVGTSAVSATVSSTTWAVVPFTEDFASGGWRSGLWVPSHVGGGTATVTSGAGVMTGATSANPARESLSTASLTDQGVLLKVTFPASAGGVLYVSLRGDSWVAGQPWPNNAVGVTAQGGGSVTPFDVVAGVQTSRSSNADADAGISSPATTTAYNLKLELAPGTTELRYRMWAQTDPEPTGWRRPIGSTTPASGTLWLAVAGPGGSSAGSVTIDDVSFYALTTAKAPPPFAALDRRVRSNTLLRR